MGQVTSTAFDHRSAVYVTSGLSLTKIVIQPSRRDGRRAIKVDPSSSSVILPVTKPLATFTQNELPGEYPFLLNCYSSDAITVHFRVDDDKFDTENDAVPLYSGLHITLLDDQQNEIFKFQFASKVLVNGTPERATMDPSVIEVAKDNSNFKATVSFENLKNYVGKVYICISGDNIELFKTAVFVEAEQSSADPALVNATYKDALYDFPNDGPEFRNILSQLEEHTNSLKALLKMSIKKAQSVDEATRHLALARSAFASSLSDLSNYARAVKNPLMFDVINDLIPVLTEQSTIDILESNNFTRNVTTPITLMYNSDIKLLSNKRKIFYDQAKEFYDAIQSRPDMTDSERLKLQVGFELNRFDYFQYLNEFRNGHSVRNMLYNASLYLETHSKKPYTPIMNSNSSKAQFYYQNYFKYKGDQQRFRNDIATASNVQSIPLLSPQKAVDTSHHSPTSTSLPIVSRDISDHSAIVSKSGVLETLGGQNKSGWHKQLIVISDNLLTEYVDWKDNEGTLRCPPIDLTFSCIKVVDTLRDHKYCIEVITPTNIKRVFQAESKEARESWIRSLTLASKLKSSRNQYNSSTTLREKRSTRTQSKRFSAMKFGFDSPGDTMETADPLKLVRDVDVSNQLCCDCGTADEVEWISINYLVVVCINCAGVHRSLGSHISKMRSLSLDGKSFGSSESQMLLYHVSNKFSNSYLQGGISSIERLKPEAKDSVRKGFITNKYAKKLFLTPDVNFNPNESLIKGVHSANVPLVLKALAYGANTKMVVIKEIRGEKKDVSLFEYSLTHCHGSPVEPIFDISQLLYLNNVPCGDKVAPVLDLNDHQRRFWSSKIISSSSPGTHVKKNSSLPEPVEQVQAQGVTKSRSMILKRNKSLKLTSGAENQQSTSAPSKKDRTNRISRLKILQTFRSTTP